MNSTSLLKEETKETELIPAEVLDIVEQNIGQTEYICPYQEAKPLLKNIGMLRSQNDLAWIEKTAEYYVLCSHLSQLEKDNSQRNDDIRARKLYVWMIEQSRYLQTVYPNEISEKRKNIEEALDNLEAFQVAITSMCDKQWCCDFIDTMLQKLKASSYLLNAIHNIQILKYLLYYSNDLYTNRLAEIIEAIYLLKCNNLLNEKLNKDLLEIFIKKIDQYEKEIAFLWFCNEEEELTNRIIPAIRLITLVLLTGTNCEKTLATPINRQVLSARICRYLSRLDTPYSLQLKNKAYTMLTDESTLDERISWYELLNFDLNHFITQTVNIRIEELNVPLDTQENKWEQYSNEHNTLTLDKDGFTLSTLFPHAVHSWRGRKDKASFMDNRVFLASFSKLTYPSSACKNITDFQLYWHQLLEDYPLYRRTAPQTDTKLQVEEDNNNTKKYPEPSEEITIGIVGIEPAKQCLEGVILDDAYRGLKAILPLTQVNACYYLIKDFDQFFSTNETYKVKVIEKNIEGIRVSLAQSYNEYIYTENCQRKKMPAMIADCEGNKIKWLLITGSTCTTPANRWIKPKVGDIYQVEFVEASGKTMKPVINVEKLKASISKEEFYKEVTDYIKEFISHLSQHQLSKERQSKEQKLKDQNNPFIAALRKLTFEVVISSAESEMTDTPDEDGIDNAVVPTERNILLDISVAEELIYCLDQLAKELNEPCDQFNAYNFLRLLCLFCGKEKESTYYELCAAYLYNVNLLTTLPFKERFSPESIQRFNILLARMEQLGIYQYGISFEFSKDIIHILCSINKADSNLQALISHENKTISNLARYFSMLSLISDSDSDTDLQSIIYRHINELLGFKEAEKKTTPSIPVYFGHEGVECEFKTSAFIHPDKDTDEDQSVALARVIASFMNTDGGTLYIGVNDNGYLTGIQQDMKFVHNDCDIYLRMVNKSIIRLLGEGKEDGNRYQEYIRCNFHEYGNQRMVLAFRVAPVREVVKVNGSVYTRSGSSCICKPAQNVSEFAALRRTMSLDSTPRKPKFPTYFSAERQEYIFAPNAAQPQAASPSLFETEDAIAQALPVVDTPLPAATSKKKGVSFSVATSLLRPNPLQKKTELGYRSSFRFISLFGNGKIACSPSPKIGVWGEEGGKVFCSYDTEGDEDLLVSVFTTGEVGISNLSKGFSSTNSPTAFINNVDNLLFCSPASKDKYLLVIAEKDDTKRYRIIRLGDFEKPLGLQPKLTMLLMPEKGTYIFAEILDEEIMKTIEDDKISLNSFDQYNAGRYWEHTSYKSGLDTISELCKLPY